jgi:hypothetical protein
MTPIIPPRDESWWRIFTMFSLDPPIIVDASAAWGESEWIGRASMW